MASSSNNEHHNGQQRPGKLARHNSSFIGAIKNIVKAPLTWFANQDDADNSTPGKRRRHLDQEPTEEFVDQVHDVSMRAEDHTLDIDEDTSRRAKRMRLHSPPKRTSQPYLDPPAAALRRADPTRRSSIVPRASSAVLPSTRVTLSPRRHLSVNRTMSIDPPQRTVGRRDSSAFNFGPPPSSAESADYDMAIDSFGDLSMPSSPRHSPRPSFRLRSSVTPQPHQPPTRYISEPPPLNTLVSHPVFLRPPAQVTQPTQPSAPPTLGALAESVRATKSPTRQSRSSLFLGSGSLPSNNENTDAPAEKALHQLDVYKTPLLPTRMRSLNLPASVTATAAPDMFKSRRKSHLVLMQDDKDRLGRKVGSSGKSSVVNGTKPYAGEGGMKKLLARRKQEAEEEEGSGPQEKQNTEHEDEGTSQPPQPSPVASVRSIPDPPAPTGADWFSTATTTSSSGSSLRVGRATNRTHIARPAKSRFSAKFDDDGDAEDDEAQRSEKRREMADEASKMVPLFKEPPGFSFSLEAPPMEASKDDDPKMFPIASLPFSITKPVIKDSSPKVTFPSAATEKKEEKGAAPDKPSAFTFNAPGDASRTTPPEAKTPTPSSSSVTPAVPTSSGGLPDFFAGSKFLKETKLPTPPPIMNFGSSGPKAAASTPFSFGTAPAVPKPVNEPENPFWDAGEKKVTELPKSAQNLFSAFEKIEGSKAENASASASTPTLFGSSGSAFAPIAKTNNESTSGPLTTPNFFSFGKPATALSFGVPSSSTSDAAPTVGSSKQSPAEETTPKPMFGTDSSGNSLLGDSSKAASSTTLGAPAVSEAAPPPITFSFGAPAQPTIPEKSTTPQPSFFGSSATSAPTPAVETPKSLFGGSSNTGFSFGQPTTEQKDAAKTPFSFSSLPSTPPVTSTETPKAAPFSFGQPTTTPAATPPISFGFSGGGSTSADVSGKSLFSFGQPTNVAPARPATPPKNENEFMMEESPTRDLQQAQSKPLESRPTIGGGPFSFGNSSTSSSGTSFFGAQQSSPAPAAAAPFSFGSNASNPFASKDNKVEEPKPFGGFGVTAPPSAPPITTSFSFGQSKPTEDAQRPLSGGGFGFTSTPTSTTIPSSSFSFGAPAASNPFAQPAATGSAPSSPSTFNQPSPFAFGAPQAPASTGFTFGSQPASPAGASLTLPPSTFGSGGGFGQPAQPSSPFSGPIALAPSTSGGGGGSLFTIGAAPAPTGSRTIKKLPTRRGASTKR